jgi:hypothetical protein
MTTASSDPTPSPSSIESKAARALPEGVGIQVYRDTVPGKTPALRRAACARACKAFKAAGVSYVAWHGFSTEMGPDAFKPLAQIAADAGLAPSWAAYGLDSDDMTGKGRRIGAVAAMPECAGVFLDQEGKGEDESREEEAAHYREMRLALQAAAPDAVYIAQTWELPQFHTKMAYDEMAALCAAFAPMEYLNNWKKVYGAKRAEKMEARWKGGREWLTKRIAPLERPIFRTTHAVGWDDIPGDLAAMLRDHPRLLVWSEPFPDAKFLTAIKRAVGDRAAARKVPA